MTAAMSSQASRDALVAALGDLSDAVGELEFYQDASASLEPIDQAAAVALVKDLRQRLGQVESGLAETLGKAEGQMAGYLPDGRQFTLKRTADRKEWQHDEWKRDARRVIAQSVAERYEVPNDSAEDFLVESATGETVALGRVLQEAMIALQNVHGSAEPKSTALKPLGLYKGDYCTSSPGGWILNAIAPSTPETTTDKDTTDA